MFSIAKWSYIGRMRTKALNDFFLILIKSNCFCAAEFATERKGTHVTSLEHISGEM